MKTKKLSLIIPIENQVRELDAKILLSCIAVQRGFTCIIGSRRELDYHVNSLPQSLYLSKGMNGTHAKMFRIMKYLGHAITAWDEEALVHMQPEDYYSIRLSPQSIKYVSLLFAWGKESADLLRQYPDLPENLPVYITGNPRGDLLRPEIRSYYSRDVKDLQKMYGDFILINTNFGAVNAFYPNLNVLQAPASGMSQKFAEGLKKYKQSIFEDFKKLIPALRKSFPQYNIVVRPHPSENHQIYRTLAAQNERVWVINEGNVVPWIRAAKALIHNGCTTAIEAYLLDVPVISYQASFDEYYDCGVYHLPNFLSYQCHNYEELVVQLQSILSGDSGPARGEERKTIMEHYLTGQEGPLACQRIVDVLENVADNQDKFTNSTITKRLWGHYFVYRRQIKQKMKSIRSYIPYLSESKFSKYRSAFQRHRYPGISLEEIHDKVTRFQKLLGRTEKLTIKKYSRDIFKIIP